MRVAPPVVIDSSQKTVLARSRSLPARQVERARVVLLASEGKTDLEIATELRIGNHKVARRRKRFLKLGLAGLEKDASRRGRKPSIPASVKLEIIHKTTQCLPSNATHWSTRYGQRNGCQRSHGAASVARQRTEASLDPDLPGQSGQAVRRESRSHHRTLSASARACHRSMRR